MQTLRLFEPRIHHAWRESVSDSSLADRWRIFVSPRTSFRRSSGSLSPQLDCGVANPVASNRVAGRHVPLETIRARSPAWCANVLTTRAASTAPVAIRLPSVEQGSHNSIPCNVVGPTENSLPTSAFNPIPRVTMLRRGALGDMPMPVASLKRSTAGDQRDRCRARPL
jgi:hypothetical protein